MSCIIGKLYQQHYYNMIHWRYIRNYRDLASAFNKTSSRRSQFSYKEYIRPQNEQYNGTRLDSVLQLYAELRQEGPEGTLSTSTGKEELFYYAPGLGKYTDFIGCEKSFLPIELGSLLSLMFQKMYNASNRLSRLLEGHNRMDKKLF